MFFLWYALILVSHLCYYIVSGWDIHCLLFILHHRRDGFTLTGATLLVVILLPPVVVAEPFEFFLGVLSSVPLPLLLNTFFAEAAAVGFMKLMPLLLETAVEDAVVARLVLGSVLARPRLGKLLVVLLMPRTLLLLFVLSAAAVAAAPPPPPPPVRNDPLVLLFLVILLALTMLLLLLLLAIELRDVLEDDRLRFSLELVVVVLPPPPVVDLLGEVVCCCFEEPMPREVIALCVELSRGVILLVSDVADDDIRLLLPTPLRRGELSFASDLVDELMLG